MYVGDCQLLVAFFFWPPHLRLLSLVLQPEERVRLAAAFINDAQNGRFEHGSCCSPLLALHAFADGLDCR